MVCERVKKKLPLCQTKFWAIDDLSASGVLSVDCNSVGGCLSSHNKMQGRSNVTYVLYQIVKQLHVSARYEDDHLTSYKNIMQKANTAGCVVHYIIVCLLFHRAF